MARYPLLAIMLLLLGGASGDLGLGIAPASSPARSMRAIVPSDTVDLALGPTRGLYNGAAVACAVAVILADDTAAVTLTSVPSGAFLPLRARRIMATGTGCPNLVGLW